MEKITKVTTLIASFAIMLLSLASCGGDGNKQKTETSETKSDALTVDQVLTNPDQYVDKTITIEGLCSHLCAHGGVKAFIQGNADNMQLRCEAFPGMNEPFSGETVHKALKVTGKLREQRIDEEYLKALENSDIDGDRETGCDTERTAHGQQDLKTLNDRIADYRARIAESVAKGGKDYLSFYYMDATGYEILPD